MKKHKIPEECLNMFQSTRSPNCQISLCVCFECFSHWFELSRVSFLQLMSRFTSRQIFKLPKMFVLQCTNLKGILYRIFLKNFFKKNRQMLVLVTRQLSLYVFLIHFCIFMFILISCSGNLWLGVPLWTALLKVRYVK